MEEAYYCESCNFSKFLVDCHMVLHECELCYECIDCEKIYGSSYLQSSDNCSACAFGFDLKGCRNCFACAGLRHKEYHIFNEPVAPDEYARRMESFAVGSFEEAERMKREFAQWILRIPRQFARIRQSEGCEGNNIFNSKHATGFDVFKCEEGKFLDWAQEIKHCYDMLATGRPQWCLDCVTPDSSFRVLFSNWCWQCSDILLSDNCHSSTNLLFCSGLKHKKYCIFNVQYTKETYERLAAQILEELATTPVWGNLFPAGSSPFAYNETVAMHHYPLTKDDVLARGWRWSESLPFTTGKETIAMANIPDAIVDSSDDILTGVLACNACARNFRILAPELALYRQMHVPIPRQCPECRYRDRLALRLRKKLWDRQCGKCGKAIRTPYASERPETVYCEECYLKEVY